MKKFWVIVLLGTMLTGCASIPPSPQSIRGEWQFAFFRKAQSLFGEFPPPPRFDTLIFTPPDKITLKACIEKWNFDGTFTLAGNELSYSFQPPDVQKPIEEKLTCDLEDAGNTLILTYNHNEMVYYRPDKFYPCEIAGGWTVSGDGQAETMQLGEDGSYLMVNSHVIGHYRLWPSRFGKTMTAMVIIPGHGGYLMIWTYERKADHLTLTPVSLNGPVRESAVTWTLTPKAE